jgi:hypothetical protein
LRVDEVRDGVVSETSERLRELRTRYIDSGIDQYFAVGRSQHSNVSARALKHGDVIAQLVRHDGRGGGAALDQTDETTSLCKGLTRRYSSRMRCVIIALKTAEILTRQSMKNATASLAAG